MSGSTRTPINRQPRPALDYESVRLFRRGTRLIAEGLEEDEEFAKIRLALHRRLGLKPWQPNIFDLDPDAPNEPHEFVHWKHVMSLRAQLLALARPRLVREEESEADDAGAEAPR